MTSNELFALDSQTVMQTYGRFPLAIDHGTGATLYSPEGKAYVDFASGIGVNCLGYGNEKWLEAVCGQAAKLQHASNLFYTEPYIRLAEIKRKPKDTIQINIEERREYAGVPYGDQYVLIDREGTVLRISDTEPTLPILGNMTITEMTPGSALQVEQTYLLTDTLSLLQLVEENDIYFKRIDFSTVIVRAYIYDDLYCEGAPANIRDNMASIQKLLQELYQQEITRGVIRVGTDNYLSYSPAY